MSSLIGIHNLTKFFGTQVLFEAISFTLSAGERVGLIGPNGSGKSTLLKILMDLEKPDQGYISKRSGLRVGYASQSPEFPSLSLEEILLQSAPKGDRTDMLTRARILLGKAQFTDYTQNASALSGGWKKRLDIVRALMQDPDILLMDEPTNHLDLEGILWLEKFLLREKAAYVVVSHDRYFLENISTKVIELNRCYPNGLFASEGNMTAFMEHKTAFLEGQLKQERGLASIVSNEIDWLRKSPKARTTKSRSRIEKAYELMDQLSDVKERNKSTKVDIEFSASERATKKLLVGKNLAKSMGDRPLFKGIDIQLSPGTRLGIVGKNGTGKTTLLKIMAGMIAPDMGTIKQAQDLRLVYFDQHRNNIPPNISLREALAPTSDVVNYRGQLIHVNGWAKKFLFSPDRLSLPVSCLSGGERARILIAKLMLEPADVLFLDEPTNDLDIPTLEVIEENLLEFSGAIVLISHDRCLMDRVCTQILGLGEDNEHEYFADYAQWEIANRKKGSKKEPSEQGASGGGGSNQSKAKKLSYNEQKELEGMEAAIFKIEASIEQMHNELDEPSTHADAQKTLEVYQRMGDAQEKLNEVYARWQVLLDKTK